VRGDGAGVPDTIDGAVGEEFVQQQDEIFQQAAKIAGMKETDELQ
jgi:hypothetical protein